MVSRMDLIDIVPRLAGLFYVFAGYASLRAIIMDAFLDRALSALGSAAEDPTEAARRRVLGTFSVGVGAGGAALALMSFWALPLFVSGAVLQALWLAWIRGFFITPEEDDEQSRRQVANAAVIYAVATVGVIWLWWAGRLGPWDDMVAIAGTVVAAACLGGWFLYQLRWKPLPPALLGAAADDGLDMPQTEPARLLIDPALGYWPLVDADNGRRVSHWVWLPQELAARIEEWDDIFQLSFDPEDALARSVFPSPEAEAGYHAEAEAIAVELRAIYGTGNVVFGPGWADDGEWAAPAPA